MKIEINDEKGIKKEFDSGVLTKIIVHIEPDSNVPRIDLFHKKGSRVFLKENNPDLRELFVKIFKEFSKRRTK